LTETSESALNVNRKEKSVNRDKKENVMSKFKLGEVLSSRGVRDVGDAVKWGTIRGTTSRK